MPGKPKGIYHGLIEGAADVTAFFQHKACVKRSIMSHYHCIGGKIQKSWQHLLYGTGILHHLIIYACKILYLGGNGDLRIYKFVESLLYLSVLYPYCSDLDDPVMLCVKPGGLYIKNNVCLVKCGIYPAVSEAR